MRALVQRIRRESLAVDELAALGYHYLIFRDAVIGVVAAHLMDGAEEEVGINHLVDGGMAGHIALLTLFGY